MSNCIKGGRTLGPASKLPIAKPIENTNKKIVKNINITMCLLSQSTDVYGMFMKTTMKTGQSISTEAKQHEKS